MNTFRMNIITPEETFAEMDVSSAGFPGSSGRFTILANHAPMIANVKEGSTVLKTQSGTASWNTGKGVVTVRNNSVTLLVHHATIAPQDQ